MLEELKAIPIFRDLSLEELKIIQRKIRVKGFQKGEMLLRENASCERIFIVKTGKVKLFQTTLSGREQIIEILGPGETPICNPGDADWKCGMSARALGSGQMWVLKRDDYIDLLRQSARLNQALNKLFATRLCHFSSLLEEIGLMDARKRLVKFLLDMHEKRVQKGGEKGIIFLPFTREEIAQRLGTARETVARYLHQLRRDGLIQIDQQRITILNLKGLENLLD